MDEEAKVRLGLDISPFSQNLRQAQREMAGASDGMHKSFLHAGSAARGFKQLMGEISAQSPIMGTALRFALNPIVAGFTAATLAAGYLKDKIAGITNLSDAMERGISDPVIKTRENFRAARKELEQFRYEQAKWLKDLHANDNTIGSQLARRLEGLNAQSSQVKKLGGNDPDIERERLQLQLALQRGAARSVGLSSMDLEGRLGMQTTDFRLLSGRQIGAKAGQLNQGEADEQARIQAQLTYHRERLRDAADSGFWGRVRNGFDIVSGVPDSGIRDMRSTIEALEKQLKASRDRVEKNNETIDDEKIARKKLTDAINDTRSKIKANHDQSQQLARDISGTMRELSYIPGGGGTGLYQPFDFAAAAAVSEAARLDAVQKSDLSYRIAHMNDPKSAAGTPMLSLQDLTANIGKQLETLNQKVDKGIDVFPIGE